LGKVDDLLSGTGWKDQPVPQSEVFSLTLRLLTAALEGLSNEDPNETIAHLVQTDPGPGPYFLTNARTLASAYAAPEDQARKVHGAKEVGVPLLSVFAADMSGAFRLSKSADVAPEDWRSFAGLVYAVVALLWRDHRSFAERLAMNQLEGERDLRGELGSALVQYGVSSDENLIPAVQSLYQQAVHFIPTDERVYLAALVARRAEERALSLNALMPFLFRDPSHSVISTAALEFAQLAEPVNGDPLAGVRYLLEQLPQVPEEITKVGIVSGLLLLGDRRVVELLGPCWRDLSAEGRRQLTHMKSGALHAPVIEWFLDWLEDSEGGEFGTVAAALARMPSELDQAAVVEIRRAFAGTGTPVQEPQLIGKWSMDEYAEHLRPRLLRLAANEAPPRIMHEVLKRWGINHMRREKAGIWMHPTAPTSPRPLLSLVPAAAVGRTQRFPFMPLEDADFLARRGDLLLCWAIFNPNGPTWSCLGRMPTEDPTVDLLFYRMLNPFGQESGAVATLHGRERTSGPTLAELVGDLFRQNSLGEAGEEPVLLGGGAPDLVLAPWEQNDFSARVPGFFLESPRMMEFALHRDIGWIRANYGRPWDRASQQRDWAFRHLQEQGLDRVLSGQEFFILPAAETPTTPEMIAEWFELISADEHAHVEVLCYPGAWHGAIDHAASVLAQNAFTFWQLDDFLSRFGFPVFRLIAEKRDRSLGDADV
jgi:hypothetical protein